MERQYFSLRQAAAYLGIPLGTLRYRIYVEGRLKPRIIGQAAIFSRPQLDEFKEQGYSAIVPDSDIMGAAEAADYLGITQDALRKALEEGRVRAEKIGHFRVYARSELDRFKEERRPPGRPPQTI